MSDRCRNPSLRWIPITERLPELGDWTFDDPVAPDDWMRRSKCVPVLLESGDHAWGEYSEQSEDQGKTVSGTCWTLWDAEHDDDEVVTHWFQLPMFAAA